MICPIRVENLDSPLDFFLRLGCRFDCEGDFLVQNDSIIISVKLDPITRARSKHRNQKRPYENLQPSGSVT
jgi:hypothetical protein